MTTEKRLKDTVKELLTRAKIDVEQREPKKQSVMEHQLRLIAVFKSAALFAEREGKSPRELTKKLLPPRWNDVLPKANDRAAPATASGSLARIARVIEKQFQQRAPGADDDLKENGS